MNGQPRQFVSTNDQERYAADGVVCVRQAFNTEWISSLEQGFKRTLSRPSKWFSDHAPEEGRGRFITDLGMAHHDETFQRFVHESGAAEIVAALLNTVRLNFFFDTMWIKGAGVRKPTNWHQDLPYYTVDGDLMCVLWVALDAMPNGVALEFVRGSHRWNRWFEPTRTTEGTSWYDESPYEPVPDVDGNREDFEVISWNMQPGDCVVFHGLMLHGAHGNPLSYDRRAYSSVWLGDDVVWAERPGYSRPRFDEAGLSPGDPIESVLFPRILPRL